MIGEFTAATPGRHSDDLYRVRLEQVDLPPRAGLALRLRAPLPVVFRARVAVVPVTRVSAAHGRRLIGRLAESDVRTCSRIPNVHSARRNDRDRCIKSSEARGSRSVAKEIVRNGAEEKRRWPVAGNKTAINGRMRLVIGRNDYLVSHSVSPSRT